MVEQLFLYGVYSIHVRPIELSGARWDAEYEIRHRDKAVKSPQRRLAVCAFCNLNFELHNPRRCVVPAPS